jgi:hypothetical protein
MDNKNNLRNIKEHKSHEVNSFWDISYGGEEEEIDEIHLSQNVVTTRILRKNTSYNTPNTPNPPTTTTSNTKKTSSPPNLTTPILYKMTPSNQKANDQNIRPSAPSFSPAKLEYDFLEDLNKTKSNISLFELMKLTQIQENFIKTLQGRISMALKKLMQGQIREQPKLVLSKNDTQSKSQVATNASLTRQRSRSTSPPFLITFKIFNRNVHNCMVDSRDSSNVMPLKVCEKLNVKPEAFDIQIIQLDRT